MTEENFLSHVKAHEGIINKILYLYIDSNEDKRDMYQEIVLQAWKSMDRFRGDSQFSTWLYRISLNTVMTFLKKESRLKKESLDTELPIATSVNEPTDRSMKLMLAIKQLSDVEKSVITLHLDDYSNDEIAEILGVSKNNVAVKIHRIKEELKKKIKG